jgi:antirestriction protein
MTTPRIYVADLAAYNNAILHGRWIDATQELDAIWTEINAMLKDSPIPGAEEFAIHDYEGFYSYRLHEYAGIDTAHAVASFIDEHGELGAALLDHWCDDLAQAQESLADHYCGEYTSLADYAEELTTSTTEIPKPLQFYIDYRAMARDMEMNGDVFAIELGFEQVHVFWNH